jgi:hypothetical protein
MKFHPYFFGVFMLFGSCANIQTTFFKKKIDKEIIKIESAKDLRVQRDTILLDHMDANKKVIIDTIFFTSSFYARNNKFCKLISASDFDSTKMIFYYKNYRLIAAKVISWGINPEWNNTIQYIQKPPSYEKDFETSGDYSHLIRWIWLQSSFVPTGI